MEHKRLDEAVIRRLARSGWITGSISLDKIGPFVETDVLLTDKGTQRMRDFYTLLNELGYFEGTKLGGELDFLARLAMLKVKPSGNDGTNRIPKTPHVFDPRSRLASKNPRRSVARSRLSEIIGDERWPFVTN